MLSFKPTFSFSTFTFIKRLFSSSSLTFFEILISLFLLIPLVSQFSGSVIYDSLWPHGLKHDRLPCPSPTPRACSNSCSSSQWCHPTISSSVVPFSSCLQSFPASGSLPMSHHLHQVAKVLEFQLQHQSFQWIFRTDFLYDWLVWSPCSSRDSKSISSIWHSAFFMDQLSHPHMTTGKTIALTRQTFVSKVMCQIFNMLSRLVIAFLPRSKHLLISGLQWFWCPPK